MAFISDEENEDDDVIMVGWMAFHSLSNSNWKLALTSMIRQYWLSSFTLCIGEWLSLIHGRTKVTQAKVQYVKECSKTGQLRVSWQKQRMYTYCKLLWTWSPDCKLYHFAHHLQLQGGSWRTQTWWWRLPQSPWKNYCRKGMVFRW